MILAQGSASSYLGVLQKSPCKTFPKLSHVISQLRIKLQAWAVPHAITSYCFTLLLLLSSVFGSHRPPHPPQIYQALSWIFNAALISPWIFQGKNETSSLGNSHVKCDSSSTFSGLASGQHIFFLLSSLCFSDMLILVYLWPVCYCLFHWNITPKTAGTMVGYCPD